MINLIYTILCKLYTYCVNFYTYCVNSCCFDASLPLFQIKEFCIKFWPKKLQSGKIFDKYHVCSYHNQSLIPDYLFGSYLRSKSNAKSENTIIAK